MSQTEICFTYKNYRGEVGRRRVRARDIHVSFGATHYHPEPQIIFRAFDLDKEAVREFALKDMDFRDELVIEEDRWLDEATGVVWVRPTAYAYAMVCKARDKWQEEAKSWDTNVESMLSDGDDADVVRVREGGGPEDLKMSLVVSFMKTRKMRDDALKHVGALVATIGKMRSTAEALFLHHWRGSGLRDYVLRNPSGNACHVTSHPASGAAEVAAFIQSHEEAYDGEDQNKA
ncbi:hypothetical protein POLEWNIK_00290 [Brevundimonas phage vB_BpoS-Polewnik]|nr:hypothetical protein POLEWNIK_00290 [Brevundimonas phage vB_BpoS-Polewnik]